MYIANNLTRYEDGGNGRIVQLCHESQHPAAFGYFHALMSCQIEEFKVRPRYTC